MDATEAAVHFARALEAAHVPYAIGGAIAYGFFGAARGTHDVDINLFVTGEAIAPAIDTLVQAGLSLDTAVSLASATERGDARGSFQGLPVDLFFNSIPVHERAAKRTREVTLHGTKIRVLSPEDTAVFKMLFYRGKDLVDVERLLTTMGRAFVDEDDFRVLRWDELVRQLLPAPA
jgi:hypothetical protein